MGTAGPPVPAPCPDGQPGPEAAPHCNTLRLAAPLLGPAARGILLLVEGEQAPTVAGKLAARLHLVCLSTPAWEQSLVAKKRNARLLRPQLEPTPLAVGLLFHQFAKLQAPHPHGPLKLRLHS